MWNRGNKSTDPTLVLPSGRIVSIDTESDGLDPYHGHRVFCWSYFTELGEWGFMKKNSHNLRWLRAVFNDSSRSIVFQNAKHDLKMLSFEGLDIYKLKAKVHCTLIMSKVLDSVGFNHDLRSLAIKYLDKDVSDKDAVMDWLRSNKRKFVKENDKEPTFKDAPLELVKRRCLWDSETAFYLFRVLYPRVQKICPDLYETERRLVLVCIDMENTGVLVDLTKAKSLRANALKNLRIIQRELNELVCPLNIIKKKRGKQTSITVDEFNPSSSAAHLPAAFKKLGIELRYLTQPKKNKKGPGKVGGGNWAFDEYALVRYVSKPLAAVIHQSSKENWNADRFYKETHQAIKKYGLKKRELLTPLIIKYRELSKLVNTYYDHIIEDAVDVFITPTGIEIGTLHCQFNQSEARTGRFSSSKPNLQNMPRLLGPRECFLVRKGCRNWHADYKQVEMRFYTHFSKDAKMAARLPMDLHRQTASDIFKKPPEEITKEERERAASINFAIIYGVGADTLALTLSEKGAPTEVDEAGQFISDYHAIYPSVRRTSKRLSYEIKHRGYITNPFGRRYYIPKALSYKALDYMCQGTSADQMKKAMVDIWEWIKNYKPRPLRSKLIMTIHDEIVFQVPYSEESIVMPRAIEFMQDLTSYFVPITVGIDIAPKRWSEKIEAEELGLQWLKKWL